MKKKIIFIDSIAFLAFLISLMPDLTGLEVHEWLGLAIGGVLLVHFLQHWQWIITVTQNIFHSKPKIWVKYLVDGVLVISFTAIMISGLMISTLLMLPLTNYETWRIIHVVASYVTLAVIGFKLAIHWDWLSITIGKWFNPKNITNPVQVDRRKFVRTCCITGLAALFALSEFKEWQTKTDTVPSVSDDTGDEEIPESISEVLGNDTQTQITQTPTSEPTVVASTDEVITSVESTEMTATETTVPTSVPTETLAPTAEVVEITGVVRCNHGCSYPGRCRRYQDTITKNNKCDLGEAIW